jgi:hypothetical protein
MYWGRLFAIFTGFILFIVILVALFGHGGKKPVNPNPLQPLPDYASTNAVVSFTTDGIVNGDDIHRQIRITVSANTRTLDVIQGYNGTVISSKTFENNQEAYFVFLRSLSFSGFLTKNKSKVGSDERGVCPLGFRYVVDLNGDEGDLSRLWTSSCGSGNWGGSLATVQSLFQRQITNYGTLVGNVNLQAMSSQ